MIDERLDKTVFSFTTNDEADADDVDYWLSKTPQERIKALEYLRKWVYGDDQVDARLQRVFTIVKLGEDKPTLSLAAEKPYNNIMSQTTTPIERSHITRTDGVCGGRPCVAGTRIRVQDIFVCHERQGQSPDEIVTRFPQLTLADVYAALAYFWDHREAILGDMEAERVAIEKAKQRHPSILTPKLEAAKDDGNSVSS